MVFVFLPRHIQPRLLSFYENFKITLLCGARQTGKTSLLKACFPNHTFISFDTSSNVVAARNDPHLFLSALPKPVILDEIQYVPELFPALKSIVDQNEDMGQYILTGSHNVLMMKQVSESLAGRVGILELYPMTYFELTNQPHAHWLNAFLDETFSFTRTMPTINVAAQVWRGGFPGLYERPSSIVQDYHQSYLRTYIDRDVRLLNDIHNLYGYEKFVHLMAVLTSQEVNYAKLGTDIGIDQKTAKAWLITLAHSYQWLELPPYFQNSIKRLSRKSKGYFIDAGFATTLMGIPSPETLVTNPAFGALFETYCATMMHTFLKAYFPSARLFHWRTGTGVEVDLVIDYNGKLFPIEIKGKTAVSNRDAKGIKAFREAYAHARVGPGAVIYAGHLATPIVENVWAIPFHTTAMKLPAHPSSS